MAQLYSTVWGTESDLRTGRAGKNWVLNNLVRFWGLLRFKKDF